MTTLTLPKQGSKVGMSSNIGTSFAFLSNAQITDPGGAQAQVQSTDNTNDTINGNGLQKVRIVYFDTSWQLNEEIVNMNGTTPVQTQSTNIQRIESFEAFQAGPFITAQGTVKLTSLDTNTLYAQIDPISTEFAQAVHTVSPGNMASMLDVSVSCTTTSGITFIICKEVDNTPKGGGIVFLADMILTAANSNTTVSLQVPLTCDATLSTQGLRMGIAVKGNAASQAGSGSFHYIEQ